MAKDKNKNELVQKSSVRIGMAIVIILLSMLACVVLLLLGVEEPLILFVAFGMFIAISAGIFEYLHRVLSSSSEAELRAAIEIERQRMDLILSLDGITDIVALFDIEGRIIRLSGNVENLLGYGPDCEMPANIEDLVHISDRSIIENVLQFCETSPDKTGTADIQLIDCSGDAHTFSMKCTAFSIDGSPAIRTVFTPVEKHDETDRIDELIFKLLIDFSEKISDPCAIVADGVIEFVNAPLVNLVGTQAERLISSPFFDIFDPDDRSRIRSILDKSCDNGFSTKIISARLFSLSGNSRIVDLTVLYGHFAEICAQIIIFKSESPQFNSQNRFNLLFENTNDAIFITTIDGKIIQANPSAEQITGLSAEELFSMSIHTLFDIELREISLRQLAWMKRGDSVHFESRFVAVDGERIDIDVSSRLVHGEDDIIISVIRDITERNRFLSRLSKNEKLESLGVLAGGVALDFNNILEAIFGAAELAMENCDNKKEVEAYLNIVLNSAEKAARLTKNLMEYAHHGKMVFDFIDLNEIVDGSIDFLERILSKKITIRKELSGKLGAIYGDPSQLKQAVINLILNAQDAMPDGGEILIQTNNFSADERFARDHPGILPGENVELVIRDSGRGIDPAIIPHLFDPFFKTKRGGEGSGLDLAITYSIVTSHDGIIDIASKPNEGTTTRVFFPVVEIEPEKVGQLADLEIITPTDKTVMIVDDEEIIQSVISSILEQLGYRTIQASTGVEAIEFLADGEVEIDVILLDMVMPGLSGWETFKKIQEFWSEIPVIVVTGYADEQEKLEIMSGGLAGFIEKPFKASQIARKLAEVLGPRTG